MAYTCQLIEGTLAAIDLQLNDPGWTLLDDRLRLNDPEAFETWGGRLENQLVRREDGKRTIPLSCILRGSDGEDLIDRANALRKRLRHAARYHIEGWGDEVFLEIKIDDATHSVLFPVITGEIDMGRLYARCCEPNDAVDDVPVLLVCEPYWEYESTYVLENYVDNPGWWRWAAAPGDSWTEVNAADVTSTQETTIYEVMGRSLKMVIAADAVNDTGVQSDNITVTASTVHYFECRCYHTSGADDLTARVYDVSNGAVIAASALTFDNQDDAWEKLGVSFTTPVGCVSVRVEIQRLAADSSVGDKTYYVDAVYLEPRSDAPTGWISGRNLTNELDAADQINVLCITEIPGEVPAECRLDLVQADNQTHFHVAKRTRNDPHDFIWELLGVNATVTAGDASCKDSALAADATAPGGQRIDVSFAGTQTMALRCYWTISSYLFSYYGRFAIAVLCKATGLTDTINMEVQSYQDIAGWGQGGIVKREVSVPTAADWELLQGWNPHQFPIGTHDNDLWDTGNQFAVQIWAEHISGNGINDTLQIAGAYLIPLDESYLIGGSTALLAANIITSIKKLDGDRGVFPYSAATNRYYPNIGATGIYPSLTPEIENWLYLILAIFTDEIDITDPVTASLTYRPQGIFLRGSDPG